MTRAMAIPEKTETENEVRIGDTFEMECALGRYEGRVLRRHRDAGYFETVFARWLTPIEPFRQGFVGSIEILSHSEILAARRALS
jgi:hypothetical protein